MSIKVTDHALARYEQRVSSKDNFRKNFRNIVREWCEKAIKDGKYLGKGMHGNHIYEYFDWQVITNHAKNVIVTITPRDGMETVPKEVEDAIKKSVSSTVNKLLRPLLEKRHELVVEIHTNEIKKLRVHNPKTKKIISKRIDELNKELDSVIKEISMHESVAFNHGVKINVG